MVQSAAQIAAEPGCDLQITQRCLHALTIGRGLDPRIPQGMDEPKRDDLVDGLQVL